LNSSCIVKHMCTSLLTIQRGLKDNLNK